MLSAYNPGTYLINSPIQKENGPRLFDPYFGFSYKGTNAWIKVYIFPSGQTNFTLTSSSITVSGNSWNTYLKNLTTVSYFSSVWNTNKENISNLLAPTSVSRCSKRICSLTLSRMFTNAKFTCLNTSRVQLGFLEATSLPIHKIQSRFTDNHNY